MEKRESRKGTDVHIIAAGRGHYQVLGGISESAGGRRIVVRCGSLFAR